MSIVLWGSGRAPSGPGSVALPRRPLAGPLTCPLLSPQPGPGAEPPSPGSQPAPVLPRKLPDPSKEQPPPLGGLFAPSPQPAERLQVRAGPRQPPEDVERGAPGTPGWHRLAALRMAAAPAVPARQPHGPHLRRLPGVRRAGPEQEHVRGAPLHLRASVTLGPPSPGTPEGLPTPAAPHAGREGHCEATGPEEERRHLAGGVSQEGMGPCHQGETLEALPSCWRPGSWCRSFTWFEHEFEQYRVMLGNTCAVRHCSTGCSTEGFNFSHRPVRWVLFPQVSCSLLVEQKPFVSQEGLKQRSNYLFL